MIVQDIMTDNPACCTRENTLREVAMIMVEHDCGCIPVVSDMESRQIIGVATDRDLTCRGIAQGRDFETPVGEIMTSNPSCCNPDDDITKVEHLMAELQVRRVPVVDGEGACIGMVAQADLARQLGEVSPGEVGRVVERISEPAHQFSS